MSVCSEITHDFLKREVTKATVIYHSGLDVTHYVGIASGPSQA